MQYLPGQSHRLPGGRDSLASYAAQHFGFALDAGVATITLNRPERKNPLTFDSYAELRDLFRAAGADMIDCSSGQVSKQERPVFGRMFKTPFSDRIRNEAGIPTIAVGSIYEADHVNGIIAAGRADLCAVARPHLASPAWTLMEAARIGYTGAAWPRQYEPGKQQLERNLERERQLQAASSGLSPQQLAARLLEG